VKAVRALRKQDDGCLLAPDVRTAACRGPLWTKERKLSFM